MKPGMVKWIRLGGSNFYSDFQDENPQTMMNLGVTGILPIISYTDELRRNVGGGRSRPRSQELQMQIQFMPFMVETSDKYNDYYDYFRLQNDILSKKYLWFSDTNLVRAGSSDNIWKEFLGKTLFEVIEDSINPNFEEGTDEYSLTIVKKTLWNG